MPSKRISRRDFLKIAGTATAMGVAHGCAPTPPPAEPTEIPGVTPGATEAVAPTAAPTAVGGPKYGGTLKMLSVQDYPTLDPHKVLAANGRNIFDGVFNGLTEYNEMQEGQPSLAHSWDMSDDGTEYTFHLVEGVKFHNGREMTADDVKFSFDRIREADTGSYFGGLVPEMSEVEVVDDYTVKVNLSSPVAYFLGFIADWKILAQENMGEVGTNPIGTGPFKVEQYLLGDKLTLVRNDDYWEEGLPYLDRAELVTVMDVTAAYTAWKNGQFDTYWKLQLRTHEEVTGNPDMELAYAAADPYNEKVTLHFDNQNGFFADKRARQAIAWAIDKPTLAETAYFGRAKPNPYGIQMGDENPFFNGEGLTKYDYDLDKAASLLEEAGASPGTKWEYNAMALDPEGVNMGVILKAELNKIGYDLEIVQRESGAWVNAFWKQPSPDVISWNGFLPSPEPSDTFSWYLPGQHGTGYEPDEEMVDLLMRGRASLDVEERKEIYHQVEKILNDVLPDTFPVHRYLPSGKWSYVQGFWQETILTHHYKRAWLDK